MAGPSKPDGSDLIPLAQSGQIGTVRDLTGVIRGYRTMFPVPLGEASSWDPEAVANDGAVSADEASADGIK
jgi:beta-glucosidase-like glycosyl hydrolase